MHYHPLEYKVVSYNKDAYNCKDGKVIFVGTETQCQDRIEEIEILHPDYAKNLKIFKY